MIFPTIHRNGTSADSLINDFSEAKYSLTQSLEALQKTAPNGRDYYPQSPLALKQAIAEHADRLKKIEDVIGELDKIMENIQSQAE